MSLKIHLNNLVLFGNHGLFEEEGLAGNEFHLDITMSLDSESLESYDIKDTIDYSLAFTIIRDEFQQQEGLLENLAIRIAKALKNRFAHLEEIEISLRKINAPIPGFRGQVGITYGKSFR